MVIGTASLSGAESWKPELLPPERETSAALAAGPPHFAAEAGVYLLTADSFRLARPSGNGFHCLVLRSRPGAFEPECFDAEGSATLLQEELLRAELVMAGRPPGEVDREIAAAWSAGRLRAPRRPGINYMLSPENRVPVDDRGTIAPYRPHVMFYVPYLTNEDLGSQPGEPGSPVFVINEGTPGAYAIVPVPSAGEPHSGH
jgi:hypothetical protein